MANVSVWAAGPGGRQSLDGHDLPDKLVAEISGKPPFNCNPSAVAAGQGGMFRGAPAVSPGMHPFTLDADRRFGNADRGQVGGRTEILGETQ